MKKIFLIILLITIIFSSTTGLAFAQKYTGGGLVPCGYGDKPACDFEALIKMVNIIIDFAIFWLALPIAAIVFAYVGFLLLFHGSEEGKRSQAKHIAWNVVFGLVIALAAWLIVKSILVALGLCEGYHLLEKFVGRSCP